jgi:hypothetical protein
VWENGVEEHNQEQRVLDSAWYETQAGNVAFRSGRRIRGAADDQELKVQRTHNGWCEKCRKNSLVTQLCLKVTYDKSLGRDRYWFGPDGTPPCCEHCDLEKKVQETQDATSFANQITVGQGITKLPAVERVLSIGSVVTYQAFSGAIALIVTGYNCDEVTGRLVSEDHTLNGTLLHSAPRGTEIGTWSWPEEFAEWRKR